MVEKQAVVTPEHPRTCSVYDADSRLGTEYGNVQSVPVHVPLQFPATSVHMAVNVLSCGGV